jgi:hypothetical protein
MFCRQQPVEVLSDHAYQVTRRAAPLILARLQSLHL